MGYVQRLKATPPVPLWTTAEEAHQYILDNGKRLERREDGKELPARLEYNWELDAIPPDKKGNKMSDLLYIWALTAPREDFAGQWTYSRIVRSEAFFLSRAIAKAPRAALTALVLTLVVW